MFEDKVVVVTGAGRGIGREIALAFAREGADLVLASRTESALHETRTLIEGLGREGFVVPTDISKPDSVRNLADQTLEHFGHVDVLVNNSGIAGVSGPLWEIEPADGPISKGVCTLCNENREFENYIEEWRWEITNENRDAAPRLILDRSW